MKKLLVFIVIIMVTSVGVFAGTSYQVENKGQISSLHIVATGNDIEQPFNNLTFLTGQEYYMIWANVNQEYADQMYEKNIGLVGVMGKDIKTGEDIMVDSGVIFQVTVGTDGLTKIASLPTKEKFEKLLNSLSIGEELVVVLFPSDMAEENQNLNGWDGRSELSLKGSSSYVTQYKKLIK